MIYNFDFRKSLGQNFLIDDSIVDNIANAIDYKENNRYYEEYTVNTINVNRPALHIYVGDNNDVM